MSSVAQVMAQTLRAYDTKHFFLLTGRDQDLWIALGDADIQMVLARSERSAAYMAGAYARLTCKPAFTYGQFGPGAAVMVGGIVDPYWSGASVIAGTSNIVNPETTREAIAPALYFLAAFSLLMLFAFLLIPETRKKTLEEVEGELEAQRRQPAPAENR